MPSTFRASRSGRHLDTSNRSRTGQIDHDVFEGLPVRRWSRQPHNVSQAPKVDDSEVADAPGGKNALPELPMPRDSQLLPAMSRALLRAARAGCIYIRATDRSAENETAEITEGEEQVATVHLSDRSFTSRKWSSLPKHMEPPEVEFLAKRRPGLSSLYGNSAEGGAVPGPMRKTKIKRTDPETGNISIYEVWVPEGHRIEGEITVDVQTIAEQSAVPVTTETPAPGTVVEGVGVVNAEGVVVAEAGSAAVMTPPKRRPPPPKRKGRGIGKGRKKKVMFAPGEGADATTVHGVPPPGATNDGTKGAEETSRMSIDPSVHDEDEDGEEGEESDDGDESMLDPKTPETPQVSTGAEAPIAEQSVPVSREQTNDIEMTDATADTETPGPEPTAAGGDGIKEQPVMMQDVQTETAQADQNDLPTAPSSLPPKPPTEDVEPRTQALDRISPSAPPAPLEVDVAVGTFVKESTPQQQPNPSASNASKPSAEEKIVSEVSEVTQAEIKPESTPQPAEAGPSIRTSVSPAKLEETHSETPSQLEAAPERQAHEASPLQPESAHEEPEQSTLKVSQQIEVEPALASTPEIKESPEAKQSPDSAPVVPSQSADVTLVDATQKDEPAPADLAPTQPSSVPAASVETISELAPVPETHSEPQSDAQSEQKSAPSTGSDAFATEAPEIPVPVIPDTAPDSDLKSEEPLQEAKPNVDENSVPESDPAPASPPAPADGTPTAAGTGEEPAAAEKEESAPVAAADA
ncbi:Uncharacterized protein PECH_007575 [Penicillium ucsense]|uniref:LYR family protein n=1 Tax=Penicillium ucsense TaxID=2839758 RepID=A0A8J8W8L5_9EURO|nr:Uncharacterized protein PECM_004470 [Penicillium ucsense]KAF7738871.1 Uncharacterized protein PECH_007575 [Penicillium ucsense]